MADISIDQIIETLWPFFTQRISERAATTVEMAEQLLHGLGRIHRDGQELKAGDRVLNDDRDLLPRMGRATGLGLSLYLGNRRVASFSPLDAGPAHEMGGYADAQLVDVVLRRRETFRGTLELAGRPHIVACRPLVVPGGHEEYGTLGMIEAFHDLSARRLAMHNALSEGLGNKAGSGTEEQGDRMAAVMLFIDDVARRLQLLALNGNIIAAQAGDHGRAFRVVCRELSSLATQAKEAVAEVRKLTEDIGLVSSDELDEPPQAPEAPAAATE